MDNRNNMLQLCRLCLVKDDVNIPIFEEHGDIRQIFLKISSCLPVKVSREDKLPKKICDGCSFKLDTLYEFCNTSANAEKQLLTWLGEAGMNSQMVDGTITAVTQQIKPTDTFVKEETIEPPDIHNEDDDDKDYMFQQKFEESASAGPSATVTSNEEEEPPPKRARRTAAVKAAIALDHDSDDDDDDSGEPMTKVEDESEESEGEDQEPSFADAPSTSADDQPGPSGVGKDGVEAPRFQHSIKLLTTLTTDKHKELLAKFNIKECSIEIERMNFQKNFMARNEVESKKKVIPKRTFTCYICWRKFDYFHELNIHKLIHVQEKKKRGTLSNKKEQPNKNDTRKQAMHNSTSEPAPYRCENCDVDFQTINDVKSHRKNNCRFNCSVCNRVYNTVHGFTVHILQHKINSTKPKSNKQYDCPDCSASFIDIVQLRSHSLISHKIMPKKENTNIEDEDGEDNFSCEQCFDIFMTKTELDEHMEFHKQLETISVEDGDFIETVTRNTNSGGVTSESGTSAEEQTSNNNECILDKESCTLSENIVTKTELESLNTSIIIPKEENISDELEDVAVQNDTAFSVNSSASNFTQVKKKTYTVVKPNKFVPYTHYKCKKCQRTYMFLSSLEDHYEKSCTMIEHCKVCGSKFEKNLKYLLHVKTHVDFNVCKYCFETVSDRQKLDTHILGHLKHLDNLCKICLRAFSTPDQFRIHLQTHLDA
ncbi:uncharacterized protein isoform X4 [Leptinotarsa decemlineata]|uniref:uncharacterized protein isoform X4 n=1 Tax=Leptinotarsa decemlineata TaxID=7539 RepID=UPI003D3080EB